MLQLVKKIPFRFQFSAAGDALAAGNYVETGDDSSYDVYDGSKWTNQYVLDEQSCAEIGGIELVGPISATGIRDKLEYVRLRINGEEYKHVNINEKMAPPFSAFEPNDLKPFFGGYVKVGDNYEKLPHSFCHNIGVPMLLGGKTTEAVPKVGPGQSISIEVRAPRAAECGLQISNDMYVILSVVVARTTEMFKKLGEHYGWLSGNNIPQDFVFQDMEENGDIAEYTVSKTVDMTEEGVGGALTLDDWTEVYGGLDQRKPQIYPYIRYADNAAATTTNEEYEYTKVGSKVLHDEMELSWNFEKRDAVLIQNIGVDPHANHAFTRMFINGRDSNPWSLTPNGAQNEYPMPGDRTQPPLHYHGPAELGRGAIVWNTKGYIGVKDDGTSIPAWGTSPTRGTQVAVWGKKFRFF